MARLGSGVRLVLPLIALVLPPPAAAQNEDDGWRSRVQVWEEADGSVVAADGTGTYLFDGWDEYLVSDFFRINHLRCGVPTSRPSSSGGGAWLGQADCSSTLTNPAAQYDPSGGLYRIPVVVHVIQHTNGSGAISDALVHSQIAVLNEDFKALPGSLGAPGTDTQIEFFLATTDPSGNPTTGITRSTNSTWYNDGGSYWNSLAWDTTRYLNIYTNAAGGNLGYAYVPNGGGVVGAIWDRVVILSTAFGRNSALAPYDLGRTTTHEVGHYLGLYHTFQGGCASAGGCASNGDLICDTNPEQSPNYSGCSRSTCGSPDPVKNYMDYSEDACMDNFTSNQARRMRCTLESWRVSLAQTGGGTPPGAAGSPAPANGATGVSTSADLTWSAGAGASSYDVYFGTDSTPDAGEFQGNQTGLAFDLGTLGAGTTYYWRIDSVNATGTTTGSVWSFTTAAGGGGPTTLFYDDFESGGLTAGGWIRQNTNSFASTAAEYTGAWGLRVRRTSYAYTNVSTAGFTDVRLRWARRTAGLDSSEWLWVEYWTGTAWSVVEQTKSTSWAYYEAALPADADNNPYFAVRFRTNASSTTEYANVDLVEVIGTGL